MSDESTNLKSNLEHAGILPEKCLASGVLSANGRLLSAQDLDRNANAFAFSLMSRGVTRGATIAVCSVAFVILALKTEGWSGGKMQDFAD